MLSTKQREIITYILIFIVVCIFLAIIIFYFIQSVITIKVDHSDTEVIIRKVGESGNTIQVQNNIASARVLPGTYIITGKRGQDSTQQTIHVGISDHKDIHLTIIDSSTLSKSLTPVTSFGAGVGTMPSTDGVQFIDANDATAPLYRLDNSGQLSVVDNTRTYTDIKWVNPQLGVASTVTDGNIYNLTKIENTTINNLALPFAPTRAVSYAVTPNGTLYVTDNHTLYRSTDMKSFTSIYTANKGSIVFISSASDKGVLTTEKPENSLRSQTFAVISTDGQRYQLSGEFYESSWSPDGSKLVVSGETSEIYDAKLNITNKLTTGNFSTPVWQDANTLFYSTGYDLWKYTLDTQESTKVISVPTYIGTINNIAFDETKNNLYISISRAYSSTQTLALYRISFSDQQTDNSYAQRLITFFPYSSTTCVFNYIYYDSRSVIIYKALSATTVCPADIKDKLSGYQDMTVDSLIFQQVH